MSTALVLSILAVICSIAAGNRFKVNMGVPAASFAVLIGTIFLGMGSGDLFGLLPDKILMMVFAITLFYGYLSENGTITVLIHHLIYRVHRHQRLVPVMIFLFTAFIGGIGMGAPVATAVMAPIALSLAVITKHPSFILACAVSYGACIGGNFILSQGGIVSRSLIEETIYAPDAVRILLIAFLLSVLFYAVLFFFIYLFNKRRSPKDHHDLEVPPPFTKQQRHSLVLLVLVLGAVIFSFVVGKFMPESPLAVVLNRFDVSFYMLFGALAAGILGLADSGDVLRRRIPLNTLVMFSGMTMLMEVAKVAGLVEYLGDLVLANVPAWLIPAFLALLAGIMSCFSSSISVVIPTLFPIVPQILASAPLDPALPYSAIFLGATCAGISPFSTGGCLLMSNCQVPEDTPKLSYQLLTLCGINISTCALFFLVLTMLF